MTLSDWMGFLGVAILLIAFVLSQYNITKTDSLLYLTLNFVGAVITCFSAYLILFWPFIILEAIWALITVRSIYLKLTSK